MLFEVELTPRAEKDLTKVPNHAAVKLRQWISNVRTFGLFEVRKVKGYHTMNPYMEKDKGNALFG